MRASLLKSTLEALIKAKRPVAIEGPPGGGKTTIVHEAADSLGLPVIECHMPTMLVEDFGIPYPVNTPQAMNTFEYKLPEWFPYSGKPGTEQGGVLLFDDRNQASTDLQKVLANIQQARTLHGTPMAEGWTVISTGNRQADRAGANRILSHLRNRETVIEFETHLEDSMTWMADHDVAPEVIAFIRFRPNLLHDFDPQRDANPSPRAWVEGVSAIMDVVPKEAEHECYKGAVGEGAAVEFSAFLRVWRNLTSPELILKQPETAPVPEDPATRYAIAIALAEHVDTKTVDAYLTYLKRIPAEFGVMSMTHATRKQPDLVNTTAFVEWAVDNKSIFAA